MHASEESRTGRAQRLLPKPAAIYKDSVEKYSAGRALSVSEVRADEDYFEEAGLVNNLQADPRQDVLTWVRGHNVAGSDPSAIGLDTEVITEGLIDSLAVMSLVTWIEERYGFEIAEQDLDLANFRTVRVIAQLVMRQPAFARIGEGGISSDSSDGHSTQFD